MNAYNPWTQFRGAMAAADPARVPWSIRLVLVWAVGVIAFATAVALLDGPDTHSRDPEIAARSWGRLIGKRVILSLAPLVVLGLVLGRFRWMANGLLTAQAAVTIALAPSVGLEAALSCVAWLLLLSPSAQRFLARTPQDSATISRPFSRSDGLRIAATTAISGLLPGSGQVLNRTYRRAAAQFVIWAAGWITHIQPVWLLTCLYSMCEAGWTAVELARAKRDTPTNRRRGDADPDTGTIEDAR